MGIKIDQFHGIMPKIHPSLLGDGMAVVAHNVTLKTGKLVPLRQPKLVDGINIIMENNLQDISNAISIHAWKMYNGEIEFLLFPGMTWMSEGNIADDKMTRTVISGETGAKFVEEYYDDNGNKKQVTHKNAPVLYIRDNGRKVIHNICKNPLPAPKVRRSTQTELTDSKRYTYFFITWVDKYGYESPISGISQIFDSEKNKWVEGDLEYMDGDSVSFEPIGVDALPSEAMKVRVYKVVTGSEEGRIQFIKEFNRDYIRNGEDGFSVKVKDEDAGEIIPEIESPFPDMVNIIDVPGDYYVGFSPSHPKTVCFSEVGFIYSWPVGYQYDVKDNIVALAVTSNSVFALTDGYPYVLSGTNPSGMSVSKLAGPASCVSQRGVCVYKNSVYFVSNQGLMVIFNDANEGTVCSNLTENIFTKEQWQAFNPSTCIMGQFDGALHLFFTKDDGSHEGLSIHLNDQMNAVTTHDEVAKCLCTDNKTDKMYYVREGGM